jgi:hypothetical protein
VAREVDGHDEVLASWDATQSVDRGRLREGRLTLPIRDLAVILKGKHQIDESARAALDGLAERLGDLVQGWDWDAEAAQRLALVQRMGLRFFAAVDEERERIARSARRSRAAPHRGSSTLEGGRDEAHEIFKQVEDDLRRRTRELKPAALGSGTREEQINRELERLAKRRNRWPLRSWTGREPHFAANSTTLFPGYSRSCLECYSPRTCSGRRG